MDRIEHLYQCYEILSEAGDKISQHVNAYKDILHAVKGSSKEKRLASQFIAKFFKQFPELSNVAINAQLELCVDEDAQIRRQAIKDLPKLCQSGGEVTPKIGETLAQQLTLDDQFDLNLVNNSLQTLFKLDAKGTLNGIFSQIATGTELVRERSLKYLANKFVSLESTILTKDVEMYLIEEVKKIAQDVNAEEFRLCMTILGSTRLGTTINGHAELVKLAREQADLNVDLDTISIEDDIVERFIQCASHAMPYFSKTIPSTTFVVYVCDKLLPLPNWNMIATAVNQNQIQLRLLKVFAEMCYYCEEFDNAVERINAIYTILREYMPSPNLDDETVNNGPPSFQFSHAECLLYALHTLGKKNNNSLLKVISNDPDKLKDFRSRLTYLARGTQGYIKILKEKIQGKSQEELHSPDNQLKVTALKTTSNICQLIRDLYHTPPIFKHNIQLSWVTHRYDNFPLKRHLSTRSDTTSENGKIEEKKMKLSQSDQKIYIPPSGKYSAKVKNYAKNGRHSGGSDGGHDSGQNNNKPRRGYKNY